MIFKVFAVGVALLFTGSAESYEIQINNLLYMQQGLGWPHSLTVVVGHEALMKLTKTATKQNTCEVITPSGQSFMLTSPPSDRYEAWGTGCGLRVREVHSADTGRWRLTSTNSTQSFTGWIEVYVEEDTKSYEAPPISLLDGEEHPHLDLTSLDNSYCLVAQPFSQSSLVSGHCGVTLDKATRAVQGNWNILVGLPGRVKELHIDRRVQVEAERLDVGYVYDSNTNRVHLYCNILHTKKNITFCRFQKTTDTVGFNVMEGLSDGLRSYYGDGFVHKQCGLTIEKPTDQDFGTWRCSVGSQLRDGNTLVPQTPMQALINVPVHHNKASRLRNEAISNDENDLRTIFVQENISFTIPCHAESSLTYCWFLHPNGTQFTPLPLTREDQQFWYSGQSLQVGDCGITFAHAQNKDAGEWTCHMGARNKLGLELTDKVNVRVTGPLAANKKEIFVSVGANATIHCHTSNGNRPLEYCRFLSPNFVGINIDDTVTKESAILGRYYFTPERYMNQGDCSLSITSVQEEDEGEWKCAAVINTNSVESSDTATLYLKSDPSRQWSRAGITGMAIGLSCLLVILGGILWYKIGRPLPSLLNWNRRRSSQQNINQRSFDTVSYSTNNDVVRSSVLTNNSDDSATAVNNP
ncbi:hypothetical protein evm_010266 [Chilo suppressalis]|nr:hypothetical protein evm_010266 [Chilo suppressalis]